METQHLQSCPPLLLNAIQCVYQVKWTTIPPKTNRSTYLISLFWTNVGPQIDQVLWPRCQCNTTRSVLFTSPNQFELEAMCDAIAIARHSPTWPYPGADKTYLPSEWKHGKPYFCHHSMIFMHDKWQLHAWHIACYPMHGRLSGYIPHVITKLGAHGCLYVGNCGNHYVAEYVPPEPSRSLQHQECHWRGRQVRTEG